MNMRFAAIERHGSRGAGARRAGAIVAMTLLAACGGEQPVPVTQDSETSAEGQVLPGSIDDSMLPYAEIGGGGDPLSPAELDAETATSTTSAADGPETSTSRAPAPRRPADAASGGGSDAPETSAPSPAAPAEDADEEAEPEG